MTFNIKGNRGYVGEWRVSKLIRLSSNYFLALAPKSQRGKNQRIFVL